LSYRVDRELGGVGVLADIDPTLVVGHIVDPVGHSLAQLGIHEVMHPNPFRFAARHPLGPAVGEVANQFLLRGVHTDRWLIIVDERHSHVVEIPELSVTVLVLAALGDLGVGLERVTQPVHGLGLPMEP